MWNLCALSQHGRTSYIVTSRGYVCLGPSLYKAIDPYMGPRPQDFMTLTSHQLVPSAYETQDSVPVWVWEAAFLSQHSLSMKAFQCFHNLQERMKQRKHGKAYPGSASFFHISSAKADVFMYKTGNTDAQRPSVSRRRWKQLSYIYQLPQGLHPLSAHSFPSFTKSCL